LGLGTAGNASGLRARAIREMSRYVSQQPPELLSFRKIERPLRAKAQKEARRGLGDYPLV